MVKCLFWKHSHVNLPLALATTVTAEKMHLLCCRYAHSTITLLHFEWMEKRGNCVHLYANDSALIHVSAATINQPFCRSVFVLVPLFFLHYNYAHQARKQPLKPRIRVSGVRKRPWRMELLLCISILESHSQGWNTMHLDHFFLHWITDSSAACRVLE